MSFFVMLFFIVVIIATVNLPLTVAFVHRPSSPSSVRLFPATSYISSIPLHSTTSSSISAVIDARSTLLSLLIDGGGNMVDDGGSSTGRSKSAQQLRIIKECVATLELSQSRLNTLSFPSLWEQLEGDWRLQYSNNAGATIQSAAGLVLGSTNPAVTASVLTVIQRINSRAKTIDHVLQLPNRSTIALKHDAQVTSDSCPAQIAIDLKEVFLDGQIVKKQTLKLPGPSFLRRGFFDVSFFRCLLQDSLMVLLRIITFVVFILGLTHIQTTFSFLLQVTYIDESLRVSRGPYGELRIFTR
jgi:hypothetical protein